MNRTHSTWGLSRNSTWVFLFSSNSEQQVAVPFKYWRWKNTLTYKDKGGGGSKKNPLNLKVKGLVGKYKQHLVEHIRRQANHEKVVNYENSFEVERLPPGHRLWAQPYHSQVAQEDAADWHRRVDQRPAASSLVWAGRGERNAEKLAHDEKWQSVKNIEDYNDERFGCEVKIWVTYLRSLKYRGKITVISATCWQPE